MFLIKDKVFLQEAKNIQKIGSDKIRFLAKLQELNTISFNGKKYLKEPMMEAIEKKKPMIKENRFLGELDHPINPTIERMITVLYKNASHLFKEVYIEGNSIYGLVENTSNQTGMDLYAFIAIDKIPIGFSLRAIGDIRRVNGAEEVFRNVELITWDAVSNPAFATCMLTEIVNMDSKKLSFRENIKHLESYIYANQNKRQEMLLENKKPIMYKIVEKAEDAYDFENNDVKIKFIISSIERIFREKIKNIW